MEFGSDDDELERSEEERHGGDDDESARNDFNPKEKQKRYNRIKEAHLNEARSISHKLTKSDRQMLKAFFGFIQTHELQSSMMDGKEQQDEPTPPLKSKSNACRFILETLWKNNTSNEQEDLEKHGRIVIGENEEAEEEDSPFHLEAVISGIDKVPSIFFNASTDGSKEMIMKSLKDLFSEGRKYTDEQQTAMVRSFITFPRLWEKDICGGHEQYSRLLITGPVGGQA